jgi:hypothetical protein
VRAGIAAGLTAGLTLVLLVGGGQHQDVTVANTGRETAAPPNSDSTTTTAGPVGSADGTTSSTSAGAQISGLPGKGAPPTVSTGSTATTTGSPRATTVPAGPTTSGPTPNGPAATNSVTGTVSGTVGGPVGIRNQRPTAVTNLTAAAAEYGSVSGGVAECGVSGGASGNPTASDAVVLRWDPQFCGVSYRLSYNGQTSSTTKTALVVTGLAADTSYTFTVTPYTSAGDGPSSTVTARTKVDNAPKLLSVSFDEEADRIRFRATSTADGQTVSYSIVSDNGGSYNCYQGGGQDCWVVKSNLPPGPWHLRSVEVHGPYSRMAVYYPDGQMGYSNCSGPWQHTFDIASIRGTI